LYMFMCDLDTMLTSQKDTMDNFRTPS
jgi:hypothetical protein